MRIVGSSSIDDVPRWSLWLVACVCFGPLAAVLFLGVLLLPLWIGMFAMGLIDPERFADAAGTSPWVAFWPICYVVGGIIGLVGLLRVLTLSRRQRPQSTRVFTIAMVAVGLATLLIFDVPMIVGVFSDFREGVPIAGLAIYVVLPLTGAAWLLSHSWRFLHAGPHGDRSGQGSSDVG